MTEKVEINFYFLYKNWNPSVLHLAAIAHLGPAVF